MKYLLVPGMLLLVAFLAVACTSGSFLPFGDKDGELRIRNRTASDIWVSVDESEPRLITAWSNWSGYYGQNTNVSLSYNGNYVFANTLSQYVRYNLVSAVDILPDGGAIRLANDGVSSLAEVYISAADDPDWGPDDLAGTIAPGDSTLWTVTEGDWDIKLVTAENDTFYINDQSVTNNQTLELRFSSFVGKAESKGPEEDAQIRDKFKEPE